MADRLRDMSSLDHDTGCILWTGNLGPNGYARITVAGGKGPRMMAHRAAWELAHGPISDGMRICHSCDVRHCVNVDHLFVGTASDNMRDMVSKGRNPDRRGPAHPYTKLTEEDVRMIRLACDRRFVDQKWVAGLYGIDSSTVSRIVTKSNWRFHGL